MMQSFFSALSFLTIVRVPAHLVWRQNRAGRAASTGTAVVSACSSCAFMALLESPVVRHDAGDPAAQRTAGSGIDRR